MKPITEQANPRTKEIDRRSTLEIITLINEEDREVALAVSRVLDPIARAVDLIVERLGAGGSLFYWARGRAEGWACWTLRNVRRPSASHPISCAA